MTARVAQGLVIASLVLLLIYGADVGTKQGKEENILRIDAKTRGIGFGVPPIILSTVAFFISMKEKSSLISVLLLVNGALIMIGGIMPIITSSVVLGLPVLGAGIWILTLGIIKSIKSKSIKTI